MIATHMDPDSEVMFKEKKEAKGIKEEGTTETAAQDATIQFDFRASMPAIPIAFCLNEGRRVEPGRVRSIDGSG